MMVRMAETDVDQELEAAADELYALRPEEFSAARDEKVKGARKDGNAALARELAKLRKPTLSAWLINQLWRDQRAVMEQLFELSQELGRAQAEASGPELRELTQQRRHIETALIQRASALARAAGVNVTDSVQREAQETLSAALAQPEVADEVRSGRLVKPASYSGFGVMPGTARPRPEPALEPKEPIDIQAAQRAREAREAREQAQRRVRDATLAVEAAARELGAQTKAVETARKREADLQVRLEQARDQLKRLEEEVTVAGQEASNAEQAKREAEDTHAAAQKELDRAQQALEA
jgi:hypothetical protein